MDSKYAAFGEHSNNKQSVKRKNNSINKLQVKKKVVLSNDCSSLKRIENKDNVQKNNAENVSVRPVVIEVEDPNEARKKLPVFTVRARLIDEIKKNHTMILLGETGSGKTTQVPQLIHGSRLEGSGTIGITQPRRVAAITIALRVAAEMKTNVGDIVGYTVRFEDMSSPRTKLKYLTDGMLLREAIVDPLLKSYSVIILDEAHERTVNTDVLFGIIKIAQKERLEKKLNALKVIIMSATMDVDSFRKYFNNCPVIYLEGRTYPVTIYHSKISHEDYQYAAVCTIFQLHATAPPKHDFLVFLTGQEEIESVIYNIKQIAREAPGPPLKLCPLYAGLPAAKQLQVWKETPAGVRKIVLATNIAEASVTIPGIKYVIDTGMVKERTWCTSTGAEHLRVCACARAAAWQRAGRAGRDAPGHAYRLYTAKDFAARPAHNAPEIVRCPLAPTMLSLIAMGLEPNSFPLIDAPPQESIKASLMLLRELGAVDSEVNPKLTVVGKKMAAFPIDPKYSKILISATEYDCLDEALSLVAVLSSENVFHTPMHKREESLKVKQKFISKLGDHITLLNVFKAFCKAPLKKLRERAFVVAETLASYVGDRGVRKFPYLKSYLIDLSPQRDFFQQWCKENYLHHKNLSYACEVRQQLLAICQRFNMKVTSCGQSYEQLLKCLVSGLFTNCAWLRGAGGGAGRYVTRGGAAATLHPAGALWAARPPPAAVLYGELLHTRRAYLLTVSAVDAHWLLPSADMRHR